MSARIGPNAAIQLGAALASRPALAAAVFAEARHPDWLKVPPSAMLPEGEVAALHAALWRLAPDPLPLARDAGRRTADYIMEHRLPWLARALLIALPPALAEPLLLRAVTAHAWTFTGSGRFAVVGHAPTRFEIAANPLARATADARCAWHEAVFTTLWQRLVTPGAWVVEERCGRGIASCRFVVERYTYAGARVGPARRRAALMVGDDGLEPPTFSV
ncbi:MAG: bacteriochlorophyll 4-vinyl reductase [Sphingomonas sp.]|uniref:bacteriochlorophyll 4-vinyl reductase n=1 Tax=Sphingomonas sp. TaxID=28214 RepID=UPI00341762E2|nr:bacteriochlorophyll 4-vinyl reductase [Sphingomonas sp.]